MEYRFKVVKRAKKDIHIYKIIKKSSGNVNIITKLFIRVFAGNKRDKGEF